MNTSRTKTFLLKRKPFFKKPVPITMPTLPPVMAVEKKIRQTLSTGQITNGKYVRKFESILSEYLGVRHVVAISSCTTGIILTLKALDLKGQIIIPSFTFFATSHAAIWAGLKPTLVDIDEKTFNCTVESIKKGLNRETSAILAVHLFGNPCNVAELQRFSKAHRLHLIFDAAHAIGSKVGNRKIGGFGDAEIFSLTPTKLLACGEGGCISTNDSVLAKRLRLLRGYGDPGNYNCDQVGLSARMTEYNAILGIEGLKYLSKNIKRRNRIATIYKNLLDDIPGIRFQEIIDKGYSTYKDFAIIIDKEKFGINRDILALALAKENIITRKYFYPPLHHQNAYKKMDLLKTELKITEKVSNNILCLPMYSHMDRKTAEGVCKVIKEIYYNSDDISKIYKFKV